MTIDEAERKRRHVWQCRRGMKEVEFVLYAYLERFYDDDPPKNRDRFAELLECQDADLYEWFTRRSHPEDPELDRFITEVLYRVAR